MHYFFVSDDLAEDIEDANVFPNVTGSDHCPVYLKINLSRPELRNEDTSNLTYYDLLQREASHVYYESLINADLTNAWNTINWNMAKEHLMKMQRKLAFAAKQFDVDRMARIQYDLVRSLDAKLLAVRSVSSRKGEAGRDNVKWESPNEKMHAALSLTSKNYNAMAARLVVKPQRNGKVRAIHVDSYYDRAMQTLYGYSLAPIAETWSDRQSFSNRKCRNTLDADYYIRKLFSGKNSPKWVVITDVKKCYESLDHDWIREHIPMAPRVLDEFLRAGYFFSDQYFETNRGIGIGCRLSPYLASMSMDGLQDFLYERLNPGRREEDIDKSNGQIIRFADDILISAKSQSAAFEIKRLVSEFMYKRGLSLSDEKTEIVHVSEGFDFLKRSYCQFDAFMYSYPSETTVENFKYRIRNFIMSYRGSQESLIEDLNKKILGFANYHRATEADEIFRSLDVHIRFCLLDFCESRYPNWDRDRIIKEFWYFDRKRRPTYALKYAPQKHVIFMADTRKLHYRPLPLDFNPYIDYKRINSLAEEKKIENVTGVYRKIWERQEGLCECCREPINPDDEKELIEIDPKEVFLTEKMAYIHSRCRDLMIEEDSSKDTELLDQDSSMDLLLKYSEEN